MPEDPSLSQPPDVTAPLGSGLPRHIAAGLACLFTLVGGIIFLLLEPKDRYVRFWSMQAIFLGGLAVAVNLILRAAVAFFGLIPIAGKLVVMLLALANLLFGLAWFILYVVTVVKAFSNQEWEIPWLGKLARRQLDKLDGGATPPAV